MLSKVFTYWIIVSIVQEVEKAFVLKGKDILNYIEERKKEREKERDWQFLLSSLEQRAIRSVMTIATTPCAIKVQ